MENKIALAWTRIKSKCGNRTLILFGRNSCYYKMKLSNGQAPATDCVTSRKNRRLGSSRPDVESINTSSDDCRAYYKK